MILNENIVTWLGNYTRAKRMYHELTKNVIYVTLSKYLSDSEFIDKNYFENSNTWWNGKVITFTSDYYFN